MECVQAQQYEEDFKEEREARAQAVGARDYDYGMFRLKEKQLEIMATEKAVVDQQLGHEKTNTTALTLELDERKRQLDIMATQKEDIDNELSRMIANSAALAMEVQEGRQRLDTTIADTARLSDEVLAKTQQVRQYKKQTDSYKAKLEETAARLQEAQRELQFQSEQVIFPLTMFLD